jgi:hypothetical protein
VHYMFKRSRLKVRLGTKKKLAAPLMTTNS